MNGRTVTLALAGLALLTPAAQAGDLDHAVQVAHQVHPLSCQPRIAIEVPTQWHDRVAEASPSECLVRFRPGFISSSSDAVLCSVTVHEWGHLAGLEHTHGGLDNMDGEVLVHHPACGLSDTQLIEIGDRRHNLREAILHYRDRRRGLGCSSPPRVARKSCRQKVRRLRRLEARLIHRLRALPGVTG